jgi:SAM-dependent methyltransferase
MQCWRDIWNRRTFPEDRRIGLKELLDLDGYDTPASHTDVANWRHYFAGIVREFNLSDGNTIYEVGCGAGGFLYGLRERRNIKVGGCDFAAPLISVARRAMPSGDFIVSEAIDFPVVPVYDVVLAHGVFHYFPDFAYARRVLQRMAGKARRAVGILDIPDEGLRDLSEQKRRELFSPQEYARRYNGLVHQYFPRSWFHSISEALSMQCSFIDIELPDYAQDKFRFNALLSKDLSIPIQTTGI